MRLEPDFDFSTLSAPDRIRLALALWESLDEADIAAALPVTPEVAAELDRRVAAMDADGDPGMPWESVLARVRDGAATRRRP